MGLSDWWDKLRGRTPAPPEESRGAFDPAPPTHTADEQAVIEEKQQKLLQDHEEAVEAERPPPCDPLNP